MFHVFHPFVSPCGSRCGSAPQRALLWVNFGGARIVPFCAAVDNKRVLCQKHRATGQRNVLPPDGSLFSLYVPVWVKMWVKQRMRDGYSEGCQISPPAVLSKRHGSLPLRNSDLSLALYNSGCQIAGKYQTPIPYKPCFLRRTVKNILQPAQLNHQFSFVRVPYSSILIFQTF